MMTAAIQWIKHFFIGLWRFIRSVTHNFFSNDGLYRASALSFTTLFALVPLMSVTFTVLSAFPVFHKLYQPVQNFVFDNFVPATGKEVQQYLESFALKASQLSMTGLVFLLISAVLMLFTIEQAMNTIWRVRVARRGIPAFLMYWAVLTLAPLLMGLSLVGSSYFFSMPIISKSFLDTAVHQSWFISRLPFVLVFFTFSLLYAAIPNCKVLLRHAFVGGFVAAVLFEIAKYGFTLYISSYDTYELLYGALATIPLFLIWVYTVWTIILIGAEVSHGLLVRCQRNPLSRLSGFVHAYLWLSTLWRAQQQGKSLSLQQLVNADPYDYKITPDAILSALLKANLVRTTDGGNYILCRDMSTLSFQEFSKSIPWRTPHAQDLQNLTTTWAKSLAQFLQSMESSCQNELQTNMVELLG